MVEAIKLTGARVAISATRAERMDIMFRAGRFLPFDSNAAFGVEHDLSSLMLLPGLVNSHDHLEFNLFPRLGHPPYPNATAWAHDIYRPGVSPVKEHVAVPLTVRLIWGGLKNLLGGATTVAHHGDYEQTFRRGFPVRVVERYGWAHSLAFSPDVRERWQRTPSWWPFVIHAGEGTDDSAHAEVPRLEELGVLDSRTVLVHGVALSESSARLLRTRRAAVAWCPGSNLFTLGRTLCAPILESGLNVILGTDSALTAQGDLLDELRVAAATGGVAAEDLYAMVTTTPARVLRLRDGQGVIRERGVADLVAVPDHGLTPAATLMRTRPELVMVGGNIRAITEGLARRLKIWPPRRSHPISVEGCTPYWVDADVVHLHAAAVDALGGGDVRLAGRKVVV